MKMVVLVNVRGVSGMRLLETCSSRNIISFLIRVESTPVSENRLVFGFDFHSEKGDDVSEPRPRLVARSGKAVGGAGCSRTGRKCEKKKKRRKSTKKLLKQSRAIRRNHGRSQGESRIVPRARVSAASGPLYSRYLPECECVSGLFQRLVREFKKPAVCAVE